MGRITLKMTVKEYLLQYREMEKSAKYLFCRYEQLKDQDNSRARFFLEEWQQTALDAIEFRQELFELFMSLPARISDLMIDKYLESCTWKQICEITGLSYYQNNCDHREGLKMIQKLVPDLTL